MQGFEFIEVGILKIVDSAGEPLLVGGEQFKSRSGQEQLDTILVGWVMACGDDHSASGSGGNHKYTCSGRRHYPYVNRHRPSLCDAVDRRAHKPPVAVARIEADDHIIPGHGKIAFQQLFREGVAVEFDKARCDQTVANVCLHGR